MASAPIVQNTVGLNPVVTVQAPTTTVAGATWRGVPPVRVTPYPSLPGLMWQARAQGRFNLVETVPSKDSRFARGPRVSPKVGTLDIWVTAPVAGSVRSFLQLGPVGVTTGNAIITLGINAPTFVTAVMRDPKGVVVVNILADAISALPVGSRSRVTFSWDAAAGTARLLVNGATTPVGDFTVNPNGVAWAQGVPLEANLDASSWGSQIEFVQVSSLVTP